MDELIVAFTSLDKARVHYVGEGDRLAEQCRMQYLTPGEGQALTYQEKYAEAVACHAGGEGPYPHLEAEAAARGIDRHQLCQEIIDTRNQWLQLSAFIEGERARCKRSIRETDSQQVMRDAITELRKVLEGIPARFGFPEL